MLTFPLFFSKNCICEKNVLSLQRKIKESSNNQMKRTKVHAFIFVHMKLEYQIKNQTINQRSKPKIRQRVGKLFNPIKY